MLDSLEKLTGKTLENYEAINQLKDLVTVQYSDNKDFQSIRYTATTDFMSIPEGYLLDDFARNIAVDLCKIEFTHFCSSLANISCKTIETTLEKLIDALQYTYDELYDLGVDIEQLFIPTLLRGELRERRVLTGMGMKFSMGTIRPTLANELGNDQIIFSNKYCFLKTYPKNPEKRLALQKPRGFRNFQFDFEIIQNLHFHNLENMRRIRVTDIQKSKFFNSN